MDKGASLNDVKTKWSIDPLHSDLSFKAKLLNISIITGSIKSFDLQVLTTGNDFGEVTDLSLVADMTSLTTNHEPRDENLRSPNFFDVNKHPYLKFKSTLFDKQGMMPPSLLSASRRDFKLHGMLDIKGMTRPVVLNGEFGGISKDGSGQKRADFALRGKISRKEFGLTWAGVLDSGQFIIADEVDIVGNIQLIKQIQFNPHPAF
jgi:polyisoprenoid-binding protein YceI